MPPKHFTQKSGDLRQVPGILPVENRIENRTSPPYHYIYIYLVILELHEHSHAVFMQFDVAHEEKLCLTLLTAWLQKEKAGHDIQI